MALQQHVDDVDVAALGGTQQRGVAFAVQGVDDRAALQQGLDDRDMTGNHSHHQQRLAGGVGLVGIVLAIFGGAAAYGDEFTLGGNSNSAITGLNQLKNSGLSWGDAVNAVYKQYGLREGDIASGSIADQAFRNAYLQPQKQSGGGLSGWVSNLVKGSWK